MLAWQTNCAGSRAVEEVAWVQAEADRTGWPHAIVGFVDLLDERAPSIIEAQASHALVRGVRQQIHRHENPPYRFAATPDIADDPRCRENLARLADRDWLFELQIFASQMERGARLARSLPSLVLVLEHAGMLEDLSKEGRKRWREGMRRLADEPNVHTKLSRLGTFLRRCDGDHIAEVIGETVEIFGVERCLWGSNVSIERLWTSNGAIVEAVEAALAGLGARQRHAVMCANAVRLYRLSPPEREGRTAWWQSKGARIIDPFGVVGALGFGMAVDAAKLRDDAQVATSGAANERFPIPLVL